MKKATRVRRFLVLSFSFALCALSVTPIFALDLDKLKAYFLSGDYQAAIGEGEKLIAHPGHSSQLDELYYILGLSYLKDDNYLRASDIFEIILKEFRHSVYRDEAQLGLGDTYFFRGDYQKAYASYKELVASGRQSKLLPSLYYRLSQCASKLGNIEEAKGYADKIRQLSPLSPEVTSSIESCPIFADFYTVQVGVFGKNTNANTLMQKLVQLRYPAFVETIELKGKKSYRVRVGKFHARQEALGLADELSQKGYPVKICP